MRKRVLKYGSLILMSGFLLAPGCSTAPPTENDIQRWIDEHQYQRADQALREQPRPDLKRINQVETASKRETQEVVKRINELAATHEWASARDVLQDAQHRLLPSNELTETSKQLSSKQSEYLQQAHIDEAIQHGNWLAERIRLERLAQGSPEEKLWSGITLTRLEKEEQDVVAELLRYTQTAITEKDMVLARRCYSALSKLEGSAEQKAEITRIGQEIEKSSEKEFQAQTPAPAPVAAPTTAPSKELPKPNKKEMLANLERDLDNAIASGDLFKTKAAVAALEKQQPTEKATLDRINKINNFLKEKVSTLDR
ncbi:MAG TPA: hypothetical protein VFM46_15060, partial [Pseudomonadales bacterium]|nr:hypothetical protein [Pseudomonadales bacterium]